MKIRGAWIADFAASLLVFVWLYTALSKWQNFHLFVVTMKKSSLIKAFAQELAYLIPIIELVLVLLLCLPRFRQIGFAASIVMLFLFTGYIALALSFEKNMPCSCGGFVQSLSWEAHLVFNLVLMGIAITGRTVNSMIHPQV